MLVYAHILYKLMYMLFMHILLVMTHYYALKQCMAFILDSSIPSGPYKSTIVCV